jgi:lipoate-protein ligase B
MQKVRTFIGDIHMDFGLDKCAKIGLKKRKLVYTHNLMLDMNREIQALEQGKMCKYLGFEESEVVRINR